jgi:hypothetical protein
MDVYIQENGIMVHGMVRVQLAFRITILIRETMKRTKGMARGSIDGMMEECMKENFLMIKDTDKVRAMTTSKFRSASDRGVGELILVSFTIIHQAYTHGRMVPSTKGIFPKVSGMAKGCTYFKTSRCIPEVGKRIFFLVDGSFVAIFHWRNCLGVLRCLLVNRQPFFLTGIRANITDMGNVNG